mmetsp:Transcript_40744/g.93737  ORF Transcript_40744/g.93737 Transcript_40744/m.93737 type:complete len:240 (-) Transcript_40744:47-766(-)
MNSEEDTQKVNGRRIKFWKLDLILKISKNSQLAAVQRILYADVDAMATVHLHSWMETIGPSMRNSWPSSSAGADECAVDLFASGERLWIGSPVNTGIFLAHTRCSRSCLEAAVEIHENAVKGSEEWTYNDQNAVVKLWTDGSGTCDLAKLPASMQSFEAGQRIGAFTNPGTLFWKPAFRHYTRAEARVTGCEEKKPQGNKNGASPTPVQESSGLYKGLRGVYDALNGDECGQYEHIDGE